MWWPGVLLSLCLLGPEILVFYASFEHIDTGIAVAMGFVYPTFVTAIVACRSRSRPPLAD